MNFYNYEAVVDAMRIRDTPAEGARTAPAEALALVRFWKDAGISRWFSKDPEFDRQFRITFLGLHEEAAAGALNHWMETPDGALALILLLDQFPRNAFRDSPRMYATDADALRVAREAVAAGHDTQIDAEFRMFVYMPYSHSESLADHEEGAKLVARLGPEFEQHVEKYSAIIRRFGRFPHRNRILGRPSRSDEEKFLAEGGFSG